MILEGLVTTTGPDGAMHLAPMGPRVEPDWSRFLLRPFPTSQTYRNLKARPQGVLHVTDDVLVLAEAAVLATRLHILPAAEVRADYGKLRVLVEKTGGPAEHAAFDFLQQCVERA